MLREASENAKDLNVNLTPHRIVGRQKHTSKTSWKPIRISEKVSTNSLLPYLDFIITSFEVRFSTDSSPAFYWLAFVPVKWKTFQYKIGKKYRNVCEFLQFGWHGIMPKDVEWSETNNRYDWSRENDQSTVPTDQKGSTNFTLTTLCNNYYMAFIQLSWLNQNLVKYYCTY